MRDTIEKLIKGIFRGFCFGVTVGIFITILVSFYFGNGKYFTAEASLISAIGSEVGAVVFQTMVCGICGSVCTVTNLIFETEKLTPIARVSLVYAIKSTAVYLTAEILNWLGGPPWAKLAVVIPYSLVYLIILFIWYFTKSASVKKMNKKLREVDREI